MNSLKAAVLAAALLMPGMALADGSPVQTKQCSVSSGTQINCTLTSNVTVGNIVAYAIWIAEGATTISSVSDNLSHTHENPGDHATTSLGYQMRDRYYHVTTGGSNTITVNLSASTSLAYIIAQEISGLATSSALDANSGNGQDDPPPTSTDGITSGSDTTTVDGDYIFGVTLRVGGGTFAAGTNFTSDLSISELMVEHRTQASAGSVAATWTLSGPTVTYVTSIMMAFKQPSSASPRNLMMMGAGQ